MERIGLVSDNPLLKSELQKWFAEIPGEFEIVDVRPAVVAEPSITDPAPPIIATSDTPVKKPRLIIFDSSTGLELNKIREQLGLTDVPWLAIGLEEHAFNPHAEAVDGATDMILMPLDRLVFLQKTEYLLAGEEAVTPSFLYLAKTEFPVELAKAVHITHLSETGCTILAPKPLTLGVEGTLLSTVFGTGAQERVEVRAVTSVQLPDFTLPDGTTEKTGYQVQLRFFGLKQPQLLEIRKLLTKNFPQGLPEIVRSASEPKAVANVAVISPQSTLTGKIQSSLENLGKFEFEEFSGFTRFLGQLVNRASVLEKGNSTEVNGPLSALFWSKEFIGPKTPADSRPALPFTPMTIMIRQGGDQGVAHAESIAPQLRAGEPLLGADGGAWSRDIDALTKSLSESDRNAFEEAVQWTIANTTLTNHPESTLTANLSVIDPASGVCTAKLSVQLKISQAEAATPSKPALVKLVVTEVPDSAQDANRIGQVPYEAIIIDGSLLTSDLKNRILLLNGWLEKYNIRNSFDTRTPVIVLSANPEKIDPTDFRGTGVRQLSYDFNDRRYHAEMFISLSRPELRTSPMQTVVDLNVDLTAYLGRPAEAVSVSECGLVIKNNAPLRKGTELLVLSPVWSEAPRGLWARQRMAVEKEGVFENEFVFYGVSDNVQKEIRKFTREDYIKKKNQGQS